MITREGLSENEQRTFSIADKYYHWVKQDGRLSLRPGMDPVTAARYTPPRRTAL